MTPLEEKATESHKERHEGGKGKKLGVSFIIYAFLMSFTTWHMTTAPFMGHSN